jgi:antitoxin ParD1/3/4
MNVSLTPELESLIQDKVASGRYASASEVVREALRLLERRDKTDAEKLEWLRKAWREGIESGPGGTLDDIEAIIEEARREREASGAGKRKVARR